MKYEINDVIKKSIEEFENTLKTLEERLVNINSAKEKIEEVRGILSAINEEVA